MKSSKKHVSAQFLAEAGIIAALYTVITLALQPISFGTTGIDLRISECLTILPMFTPAAVPGLFIGCLISNILGGAMIWDVIFGSLATLIGAALARPLRHNRWLVPVPTIVANTLIVPFVLKLGYGVNLPLPVLMLTVGAGEVLGCYVLGEILAMALMPVHNRIFRHGHAET